MKQSFLSGFLACVCLLLACITGWLLYDYRKNVSDNSERLTWATGQTEELRAAILATHQDVSRLEAIEKRCTPELEEFKGRLERIEKRVVELSRLEALKAMTGKE